MYFSSEKNVNSYAPVYTNFTVFNKNYNVNSIFYNDEVSDGNWEYLYYGDVSYDNPLKRAGWSSSLGYESVQSYLFCEDEITNDIMSAYLVNASKFSGVRKVVYDNFLTALAYQWLADKLANELADEYHVGWDKIGYPLVSSFTGVNGRFISVIYTTCAVSGLDFNRFNQMYGLYGSLLEEYVMSLTGSEATCAVSEVFKGLLNGEEFYYYYDSENLCTVLKLADNSSWLEFSDWGYINSLINRADLQNKYNGGMCLGDFNYGNSMPLVSNLESILNSGIDIKVSLLDLGSFDFKFKISWTEEQFDQAYNILGDIFISASTVCIIVDSGLVDLSIPTEGLSLIFTIPVTYLALVSGVIGFGFKALYNDVDQNYNNLTRWKLSVGDTLSSYLLNIA